MRFFDAHCDTVIKAFEDGLDFVGGGPQAQIDLPRLLAVGSCVQVFAVFARAGDVPRKGDVTEYAHWALATIRGWAAASGGRMRIALTGEDVRAASGDGATAGDSGSRPVYGLLGLEGADCLGDKAENLRHYFAAGVRHVIPAWGDNAFSGTASGTEGPLTAEGVRLIELCEHLSVMVDVSHLSDAAFWQIRDMTKRPFIASHSNCRALCPAKRNLTDEMIRALAERGGVMGINLAPDFLDPTYKTAFDAIFFPAKAAMRATTDPEARKQLREERNARLAEVPRPGLEWIARHVAHAIQVGGEECIGLGGDLDGICGAPEGIIGIESYPAVADALQAAGLTAAQIERVCWRNMARVFAEVLP